MRSRAVLASPVGPLALTSDGQALTGLHFVNEQPGAPIQRDVVLAAAIEQLQSWFAGDVVSFDLPLAASGTPFQQRVWAALRLIPYGTTTSYGAIAAGLGDAGGSRAVGLANGRNPISIVVPCHRVIGSTGSLIGYGGGLERKRWLLDHEARVLARRGESSALF